MCRHVWHSDPVTVPENDVFHNPHGQPDQWRVASAGEILRVLVGSGVHGTSIDGYDDRDEMGICLEPPSHVCGLRSFEQYIYRTQPEGHRSGVGDLDLTIYSARKWLRLAMDGNPTVLTPFFVPKEHILASSDAGESLLRLAPAVLSRQAGHRYLGYLRAQRDRLLGVRGGKHTNRPELIDMYGFDTKYAHHMVRLGLQGVELLETGRVTLPIPEPSRSWLIELRLGKHTKEEALDAAAVCESRLEALIETSDLPPYPDRTAVDNWLVQTHLYWWEAEPHDLGLTARTPPRIGEIG